jgi:hypothetical protein
VTSKMIASSCAYFAWATGARSIAEGPLQAKPKARAGTRWRRKHGLSALRPEARTSGYTKPRAPSTWASPVRIEQCRTRMAWRNASSRRGGVRPFDLPPIPVRDPPSI